MKNLKLDHIDGPTLERTLIKGSFIPVVCPNDFEAEEALLPGGAKFYVGSHTIGGYAYDGSDVAKGRATVIIARCMEALGFTGSDTRNFLSA